MDPYMKSAAVAPSEVSVLELDPSLKPLLGSMCWNVTYNLVNLSMELGEPILQVIHEPVSNVRSSQAGEPLPTHLMHCLPRRRVAVRGHWTLWIYHAHWRIVRSGVGLASGSSSMQAITPALLDLQGQRLIRARVNPGSGATRFEFDLDTVVEVRRKRRRSCDELWLLYGLDGYERSVRGNGAFSRDECRL